VMSHRLVPSIYQVFMAAIDKIQIPPGLWRTFRDYAQTWRHRPAVVYGSFEDYSYRKRTISILFRLGTDYLCTYIDCCT
jgi:hypothetical protein